MAWPDKLKLKKGLLLSLTNAGFASPTEMQLKTLSRINGGQDLVGIGPEGCGKTTTYILAVLNRFTHTADGVTRVLILVPDKERVLSVINAIDRLNHHQSVKTVGLYAAPGTEAQLDALADGADIVVATPDRARTLYLKMGLNVNKIELLILDDAELIVKQGLQLPVAELANAITKCQHLVFAEVIHARLEKMIAPFMKNFAMIEVEESSTAPVETCTQLLYHLPNFGTKLNLLNLFMQDEEIFTKTIVFVNTRPTAEKLYHSLHKRLKNQVALYRSWFFEWAGFSAVSDFSDDKQARVLIAVNEDAEAISLQNIPFLLHFELPEDREVFINRIRLDSSQAADDETLAITLATDLELGAVRKIEQAIGRKIPAAELPENLPVEQERKRADPEAPKPAKGRDAAPAAGEAFHEKKASNAKTYNYRAGLKAKMTKKKNH